MFDKRTSLYDDNKRPTNEIQMQLVLQKFDSGEQLFVILEEAHCSY